MNKILETEKGQICETNLSYAPEPWDRQVDEGWRDFELFCRYRDALPSDRRWTKFSKVCGCSVGTIKRMAEKNNWEKRLSLYNDYLDREKREMAVVERERMYTRQINLALQMQEVVQTAIENTDIEEMTPNDTAKWLKLATDIEIRARGEPTERIENTGKISVTQNNTAVGVILDDEASKLACDLLEQLAARPNDASRIRVIHDKQQMDAGSSSGLSQ
jgi:hypothetical protein